MTLPHRSPQTHFTPHLALRFTDSQIQLAQSSSNYRLKIFATQPLPPGTIDHGIIKNPQLANQHLKNLLTKHPTNHRYLTIGIPENSAFIKTLPLPHTKESEISDAISWQKEQLLPLPSNQMYFDWCKINSHHGKSQILLAALPKTIVDTYLQLIRAHQLQPLDIETTSLTLVRLSHQLSASQPLLLIDAEPTLTSLILEPPSSIILTSITPPQAPNQPHFIQAQESLSQMINFYQKRSGKTISSIAVTGQFASHLKNHPLIDLPHQYFPLPPGSSTSLLNQQLVTSLAQKPIAPPQDPYSINLLPPSLQARFDQAQDQQLTHRISQLLTAFLLITNLGLLYPLITLARLSPPPSSPSLSSLPSPTPPPSSTQINQLEEKASIINQILDKHLTASPALTALAQSVSSPIITSFLSFDPPSGNFALHGFSPNRQALISLKNHLTSQPQFSQLKLPLSALEKSSNITFSLSGIYQPNQQNKP